MHIAIIWQRFLPYHVARITHLSKRLRAEGHELTAIEVASQDQTYGFPEDGAVDDQFEKICCFPGISYHELKARTIHRRVLNILERTGPDFVFCPATPFPEGMGAIYYGSRNDKKVVIMDDAFEHMEKRGPLTRITKRLIHAGVDGMFIPAATHLPYHIASGFSNERVALGVSIVDNDYFHRNAEKARHEEATLKHELELPEDYFLFVGRIMPRKGLDTLMEAYGRYLGRMGKEAWELVLVGNGEIEGMMNSKPRGVRFTGAKFGDDLCKYYGLARMLVVPSYSDPWALVVNEGMASNLPVIVSQGCGASRNLVREGENGWTFKPGDVDTLTNLLHRSTLLGAEKLAEMGRRSSGIMDRWSLDTFVDSALKAIRIPKRRGRRIVSSALIGIWKGWVRVN